jgi:hypothetical protein
MLGFIFFFSLDNNLTETFIKQFDGVYITSHNVICNIPQASAHILLDLPNKGHVVKILNISKLIRNIWKHLRAVSTQA